MSVAFDDDVNLVVEIGFDSDPFDETQSYTDISQYVRQFSIKRGRINELAQFVAGSATVLLSNTDNRFNPTQTTHYYDSSTGRSKIQPYKVLRISAVHNSVTYRLFYGYLTNIPVKFVAEGADSTTTFVAVDLMKLLQQETLESRSWLAGKSGFSNAGQTTRAGYVDTQELSSARATRILQQAGLAPSQVSASTGSYQVQQQAVTENMMNALRAVEKAEGGQFFMAGNGNGIFRDRTYPYTNTKATTVQATFSNTGSDLPYQDVEVSLDDQEIINIYNWTRTGGTEQEVADADSIFRYSAIANTDTTINTADDVVLSLIQEKLARTSQPNLRIDRVVIKPRQNTSIWEHALGREIGDRIKIKIQNVDGSTIEDELFVESINHNVNGYNQDWTWTMTLSPSGSSAWILGFAKLGEGTKFVY